MCAYAYLRVFTRRRESRENEWTRAAAALAERARTDYKSFSDQCQRSKRKPINYPAVISLWTAACVCVYNIISHVRTILLCARFSAVGSTLAASSLKRCVPQESRGSTNVRWARIGRQPFRSVGIRFQRGRSRRCRSFYYNPIHIQSYNQERIQVRLHLPMYQGLEPNRKEPKNLLNDHKTYTRNE